MARTLETLNPNEAKCMDCGEPTLLSRSGIICSSASCKARVRLVPKARLQSLRRDNPNLAIGEDELLDDQELCEHCKGTGEVECEVCDGTGSEDCPHCGHDMECEECDGERFVTCCECDGDGYVSVKP